MLLETLADQLPPGSVRFNSKLAKIDRNGNGETVLELVDGTQLSAKVKTHFGFLFPWPTLGKLLVLNHNFKDSFQTLFPLLKCLD